MKLPGSTLPGTSPRCAATTVIALRVGIGLVMATIVWNAAAEEAGATPSRVAWKATPAAAVATETTVAATQAALQRRLSREKEAMAQERLMPTTPEKLIERHGFIGSIFSRPTRVNPLQLLNPKAPKEYGGMGEPAGAWSWNSRLAPGHAPLPRGFQDPVRHEATAVLVGGSFR